jgi:hypothetical protein
VVVVVVVVVVITTQKKESFNLCFFNFGCKWWRVWQAPSI